MTEKTRAYIYRVFLALAAVAVGYGLFTDAQAALWIGVATAVLGNGLAAKNTSTKPKGEDGVVNLSPIVTVLFAVFLVVVILWLVGHPLHIG